MSEARPRRRPFVAGVSIVLGASVAAAQSSPLPSTSPDSLPIGAHVRGFTSTSGASIEGFVRGTSADTIRVGECKRCDPGTPVPLSTLRRLEVERRRYHVEGGRVAGDILGGLFVGTIAGAAAGSIYAFHEGHARNRRCRNLYGACALAVPYWGAIGGAAGLVGGGIIGLSHR